MPFTVFDIETRIDKALVKDVYHRGEDIGEEEAFQQTREELMARRASGSDFFPVAFHVPVAIVLGDVDEARVLGRVEALAGDEVTLVRAFWDRVEQSRGTLVTFNGRGFDLPVMELAAFRHGCRIPHYFDAGFRDREADEPHYDVYDVLTNGGAYGVRGGLHLLARLIDLPGKHEVSGGDVQALWEAGRLPDIQAYCRRDVIHTYFLFLRLELMRGRITTAQYDAALAATQYFRAELG